MHVTTWHPEYRVAGPKVNSGKRISAGNRIKADMRTAFVPHIEDQGESTCAFFYSQLLCAHVGRGSRAMTGCLKRRQPGFVLRHKLVGALYLIHVTDADDVRGAKHLIDCNAVTIREI